MIEEANMKEQIESNDLSKNKFKERVEYSNNYNLAVFKIFSDYFNMIYQNKKKQEKDKIQMIGLMRTSFCSTIDLCEKGRKEVLFKFLGLTIKMGFDIYKSGGEVYYTIDITSAELTNYKSSYIYNQLFQLALRESELIGSYITMQANYFGWNIKNLEKRSLNDVYLPESQIEDLKMFIDIYANNDELLRYLLVGVPGTCKTESCLAIMNELKDKKVTIIKTPVCRYLNEKVNLAVLLKPCLIIFDDLDLSLGSRSSGGYSEMLQSFLDILDGTDKLPKDVGILATTNSASLLDLAAQRPGRFDKVMIFDEISKDNIKKIILKSLKFNSNLTEEKDTKIFVDDRIIDKFFTSEVTGAHIYNSISMMKLKYDMLAKKKNNKELKITVEWLLEEIKSEIKIIDRIKSQGKIDDKMNNNGAKKTIGFGLKSCCSDEISGENEIEEPCYIKETERYS